MKRTKEEVFIDCMMGIESITLFELHSNIDYNNSIYIFEDYFDSPSFKDDYIDMYYCTTINQYVAIIRLNKR